MTVIAFKDGVMAADTQLSQGNAQSRAVKIFRLPDGGVAGGCGLWSAAYAGLRWLAAGGSDDGAEDRKLLPDIDGATILIAKPDGTHWVLEDRFPAFPLMGKVAAIGCGADAAEMAMGMGLSAVEAVGRVTRQDILCGGNVQSLEVEATHEYTAVKTHPRRKAP